MGYFKKHTYAEVETNKSDKDSDRDVQNSLQALFSNFKCKQSD